MQGDHPLNLGEEVIHHTDGGIVTVMWTYSDGDVEVRTQDGRTVTVPIEVLRHKCMSCNGRQYHPTRPGPCDGCIGLGYQPGIPAVRDAEDLVCQGHPDGPVMGETFYCDGSCRSGSNEHNEPDDEQRLLDRQAEHEQWLGTEGADHLFNGCG